MKKKTTVAKDVDEYLARVPKEARTTLEKLRQTIKAAAPMAAEVISYQMPMYKHHGMVIGFAAFKDHTTPAQQQDFDRFRGERGRFFQGRHGADLGGNPQDSRGLRS